MPRANPVADLAQKLLSTLEQQRQVGADFPLTVERLASLADPQATPEQVSKALNKKPFAALWIIANKKDRRSPIVLAEDAERLASSPQLLEYALDLLCSADKPLHPLTKVLAKVDKALRPAFQSALERSMAENRLPATVGATMVRGKPQLYLQRFPPPPPKKKPAEELSEQLVQVLHEQRERGDDAYPLPLDRLYELTGTTASATVRKQALGKEPFRSRTMLALPKRADSLVALAGDRMRLLAAPRLLHDVLTATRTADNQAVAAMDLVKKLPKTLRIDFRDILHRRVSERGLPDGIGVLYSKKKPLLFLLAELDLASVPSRPVLPPVHIDRKRDSITPQIDFASLFEEVFARLDRDSGGHNHVSLVDLRRAVPLGRAVFDAELQQLRRGGRYSLSAAEGRYGLRTEEREAGIQEGESLLLFVSRRE